MKKLKLFGSAHMRLMAALWKALGNKGQVLEAVYFSCLYILEAAFVESNPKRREFLVDEIKFSMRLALGLIK